MTSRCDVTIREADNGYIVELREDRALPPGRGAAGKRVFPSYESLSAWLAVHFSKAEPVSAVMGAAIGGLEPASFLTPEQVRKLTDPMARPSRDWNL